MDFFSSSITSSFSASFLRSARTSASNSRSRRAAQADLFTYIEAFYNTIRPHSSLGWLPPRDFEKRLLDWEAA